MDVPLEALSEEEEAKLRKLLKESGSASLPYARGVASAVACDPSLEDPAVWLPLVLSSDVPDQETLKHIFSLLMRDLHAVSQCLQLGEPFAPHPEEHLAIRQFCKGFVRATRTSESWQHDPDALALVLPMAVLAGYLDLSSLRKVEPQSGTDDVAWAREQRVQLKATLSAIFEFFEPRRVEHQSRRSEAVSKVGRNEPCPCGSGKKFKRCCGALS